MKILLLSPYDAASHRRWREGLARALPEFDFTQIALPARHFSWRLRGNSLTYAFTSDPRLDADYDLVLATSMTDLSALRGMRPRLAGIPTVVYFHENQFAYPQKPVQNGWLEARVLNLYTALAADHVVFNSRYNRDTFLAGVEALLLRMPDHVPRDIVPRLRARSHVLPVPLDPECFVAPQRDGCFSIVWNHRWEYDKGPQLLLEIVRELTKRARDFRVHLLGQRFRNVPGEFQKAIDTLADHGRLGRCGFVMEPDEYRRVLAESHVVLSTALHEFQGIAVLEAVAAGCIPLVPDRLVYPEYFAREYRYRDDGSHGEADAAVASLLRWQKTVDDRPGKPAPDVSAFGWPSLAGPYRELMHLAAAAGAGEIGVGD